MESANFEERKLLMQAFIPGITVQPVEAGREDQKVGGVNKIIPRGISVSSTAGLPHGRERHPRRLHFGGRRQSARSNPNVDRGQ